MPQRFRKVKGSCIICGEEKLRAYTYKTSGVTVVQCGGCGSQWSGFGKAAVLYAAILKEQK